MGFLAGKRLLVTGVLSNRSIAYGIARACRREGAELAFTYQNEKLKNRVEEFAAGWGSNPELCFPCDVADDTQIEAVFAALAKKWDGLDCIVHSVGFAPGDQLVLYTDGLVETRKHSLDERLDAMLALLDDPARPLEELCDLLLRALHHPDNHDDVALLVARARTL